LLKLKLKLKLQRSGGATRDQTDMYASYGEGGGCGGVARKFNEMNEEMQVVPSGHTILGSSSPSIGRLTFDAPRL
jgi:hypothetical protein